jgi:hypothetical protein
VLVKERKPSERIIDDREVKGGRPLHGPAPESGLREAERKDEVLRTILVRGDFKRTSTTVG